MSATVIKWDNSQVVQGERVRTAMYADHVSAQELTDTDNKRMTLEALGGWDAGVNPVQAVAKRVGRTWTVSVFTSTFNFRNYRTITLRPRPIYRFDLTKAEAIAFMFDNA